MEFSRNLPSLKLSASSHLKIEEVGRLDPFILGRLLGLFSGAFTFQESFSVLRKSWSLRALLEHFFPKLYTPLKMNGCTPGRLTWNLKITHLERKIIFQTIIFRFYVNLPGCNMSSSRFGFYKTPPNCR